MTDLLARRTTIEFGVLQLQRNFAISIIKKTVGIGVARIYGWGPDVSVFNANAAQVDTICAYCHDALLKTTPPHPPLGLI